MTLTLTENETQTQSATSVCPICQKKVLAGRSLFRAVTAPPRSQVVALQVRAFVADELGIPRPPLIFYAHDDGSRDSSEKVFHFHAPSDAGGICFGPVDKRVFVGIRADKDFGVNEVAHLASHEVFHFARGSDETEAYKYSDEFLERLDKGAITLPPLSRCGKVLFS